jgi:hypothetical protein
MRAPPLRQRPASENLHSFGHWSAPPARQLAKTGLELSSAVVRDAPGNSWWGRSTFKLSL